MSLIHLFTDGSFHPPSKIGIGAYILLDDVQIDQPINASVINYKKFEGTTSSKLELQTFLWAVDSLGDAESQIIVYTDAQSIITFSDRKDKMYKNNFHSKKGKPLNNHKEYRKLFDLVNKHQCTFIKVKGHQPNRDKGPKEHIFGLVDKGARKKLRSINK